jgi:uncharacterized protein with beta-barrel porin domain
MHGRVAERGGRARLCGLLASSSVAALLIGGGAPPAFANCQLGPAGNQASVSNSGAINCINIEGITVTGDVTNTDTGVITASGPFYLSRNGIIIQYASVGGAVVNAGQITASDFGNGIFVTSNATVSGGIANSGTIAATLGNGVLIGSTSTVSVTISSFGGGITNSGTITASSGTGIVVGDRSANDVTITISTFAGGITNSGTIAASIDGIRVGGGGRGFVTSNGFVTISTFAGGISNSGTISAGQNGIFVGGAAAAFGAAISTTISTFSGGITNSTSGSITAGNIGILVGGTANAGASVTFSTFSGGIGNSGTISAGNIGIYVNDVSTLLGGVGNSGTISAAGGRGIAVSNVAQFGATSAGGGISNSGAISAAGAGIAIANVATFFGNISNAGTITGATGVVIGAGVNFAAGVAIVNSGTITGATLSINDTAASGPVTINQTGGLISGNIALSAHSNIVNITGGSIAGDIVGSGTGTLNFNLGAASTYTDTNTFVDLSQVNVDNGTTLVLNSTGNSASAMSVGNGGTLSGTGTVATTLTVLTGGSFAPGSGTPGSSMNIAGTLAFQPTTTYKIYLNPTTASFANVTGNATLNGTVDAVFSSGGYVSKQYTILTTTTGLGGTTFAGLTNTNMPSGGSDTLSYSTNDDDVYLNLTESFAQFTGLSGNQQAVASALANYFNTYGGIPAAFFGLNAGGLTKLDGEDATGAQKGAFQLMTQLLDLMLDPTAGGGAGGGGGASGFADEEQANLPPDVALAYARALHKPQAQSSPASGGGSGWGFDQRWSAWGSAFGGSGSYDGNATAGSTNVTASDYGYAAGMDYHVTPDTVYGFALGGGGTNWNLATSLGSGRSDSFEAGVYAKTHWGAAYMSGALGFANHWFTTDRIALGEDLTANFQGQSYAARGEVGYRYGMPVTGYIVGVTPYAALQVQDFHTPSYSETDLTGGGFGLSYNAMSATDTRSELGARFDNLTVWDGMPLILRGRLAWAHDWVSNPALGAVFETLPGSNFTVNGAAVPQNSALTTAAAELHLTANWSAIAKFDGEFAPTAQTYAGTGTLKYSW